MTACYASTVSRTCWHALDATLAHVCERLCTYSCEMGLGGKTAGCKAFIPKQLGSQSELIEVFLRAFQWRVCQSPHSDSHEDHQPAQLAAKVKKKTKCADCVVMACHWENSTLKKYMYGTTARREKKK